MNKPTFGTELERIRRELCTVVDKMNRDRSNDAAMLAQAAVCAVGALVDSMEELGFDETDWDWEPEEHRG